jgi:hypothetical protein
VGASDVGTCCSHARVPFYGFIGRICLLFGCVAVFDVLNLLHQLYSAWWPAIAFVLFLE